MLRKFHNFALLVGLLTVLCASAQAEITIGKESLMEKDKLKKETSEKGKIFFENIEKNLFSRNIDRKKFCDDGDAVSARILREYGAMFLAVSEAVLPAVCMFTSEDEVKRFQDSTQIDAEEIDGAKIELQVAAMEAFRKARAEAQKKGLNITPRDGAEAGRRNFADTLRLWNSRFEPACDYWLDLRKISAAQVENLKSLPIKQQVKEVLELEKSGIYFNTFFNRSILYSVAAPGTSQHLSMLAIDINEYGNKKVRDIMHKNGWFRTVRNDAPHFTFLGLKKEDLRKYGLKKIEDGGEYFVPNV